MPAEAIKSVSNLHPCGKSQYFWCDFQSACQGECTVSGPGRRDHKADCD